MTTKATKQGWEVASSTTWTCRSHRGYTGLVTLSGSGYTLTITGTGAPADVAYATLKLAKHAYSIFLRTK